LSYGKRWVSITEEWGKGGKRNKFDGRGEKINPNESLLGEGVKCLVRGRSDVSEVNLWGEGRVKRGGERGETRVGI